MSPAAAHTPTKHAAGAAPERSLSQRMDALKRANEIRTRRARLNSAGDNEGGFLDPLHDVVSSGMTPADRLLDKYRNEWGGDVSHIYEEQSF